MQLVNERRARARAPLAGGVVVYMGDDRLPSQALDISGGGIALLSPVRRPIGGFLRVNFTLNAAAEQPAWHDADGVITRVAGHGKGFLWGIRFVGIAEPVLAQVNQYVEYARWVQARQRQAQTFGGQVQQGLAQLSRLEAGADAGGRAAANGPLIHKPNTQPWLPTAPGAAPPPVPVAASPTAPTVKLAGAEAARPDPARANTPRTTPSYAEGAARKAARPSRDDIGTGRMDVELFELYQAALDELEGVVAKKRR